MIKTYFLKITGIILLITLTFGCSKKPVPQGIQTVTELKTKFADPPSEYRSVPLWDWNDKITEEGIDFQMEKFKNAGIGRIDFVFRLPEIQPPMIEDNTQFFRLASKLSFSIEQIHVL